MVVSLSSRRLRKVPPQLFVLAAGTPGLSRGVSHPPLKALEGRGEFFLGDYERSPEQVNFLSWLEPQIFPRTHSAPETALPLWLVSSPASFPAVSPPGPGWHISPRAETLTKLGQSTLG